MEASLQSKASEVQFAYHVGMSLDDLTGYSSARRENSVSQLESHPSNKTLDLRPGVLMNNKDLYSIGHAGVLPSVNEQSRVMKNVKQKLKNLDKRSMSVQNSYSLNSDRNQNQIKLNSRKSSKKQALVEQPMEKDFYENIHGYNCYM